MLRRHLRLIIVCGGLLATAAPASAHISLATGQARIGAPYRAVLLVPHGCSGSATKGVRVKIPEGVIAVTPESKSGWKVEVVTGKYEKAYPYEGSTLNEGVKEVRWSDGALPAKRRGEFAFGAFLTNTLEAGTMLYFPVVQECEKGVERWIEIPAAGKGADDYERPAPALKLMPTAGHHD